MTKNKEKVARDDWSLYRLNIIINTAANDSRKRVPGKNYNFVPYPPPIIIEQCEE